MTKKVTVSVPDDVADWLEQQGKGNVSGAVTDAVRAQMAGGQLQASLRQAGMNVTEAGKDRWRPLLAAQMPAEVLAEGRRQLDDVA
ncbi:hypothetical protein [Polymorphospora sp. NPDC050346]|uniref:hypothetical protein n=1 Tax=Polymorphospora sp. NPDC050346 TaxID=3155780 RepID=UPI0033C7FBF8